MPLKPSLVSFPGNPGKPHRSSSTTTGNLVTKCLSKLQAPTSNTIPWYSQGTSPSAMTSSSFHFPGDVFSCFRTARACSLRMSAHRSLPLVGIRALSSPHTPCVHPSIPTARPRKLEPRTLLLLRPLQWKVITYRLLAGFTTFAYVEEEMHRLAQQRVAGNVEIIIRKVNQRTHLSYHCPFRTLWNATSR